MCVKLYSSQMGAILSVAGDAVHVHSTYRCHTYVHCCSFNLGQRRCINTANDAHSVCLQQTMLWHHSDGSRMAGGGARARLCDHC